MPLPRFLPLSFAFRQGKFLCVFLTFALPTELRRIMAAAALCHFRVFASNLSLHSVNLRVNLVALSETTNIMINSHHVQQIGICLIVKSI